MPTSSLHYRQLRRRIRPPRVATRLPRTSRDWEPTVLRMLENISITWGGAEQLLIPVDDTGHLHPRLWRLIELYDPDKWAAYTITRRGQQLAQPIRFDEWLTKEAEAFAETNGITAAEAHEMLSAEHIMTNPIGGWPPPQPFIEDLKRYTGPLTEAGDLIFSMYRADGPPGHHLVDVTTIDPLPEHVYLLDIHDLPPALQILIAMRCGNLAFTHIERLLHRSVSVATALVADEDLPFLLRTAWLGREAFNGPELHSPSKTGLNSWLREGILDNTPLALSCVGCARLTRFAAGVQRQPPSIIVGSHIDDFAYAWCLERCGVNAFWLPGDFANGSDDLSETVRNVLMECVVTRQTRVAGVAPVALDSLSLSSEVLRDVVSRLQTTLWGAEVDLSINVPELPDRRTPALLDAKRFDDPLDVPFRGNQMAGDCPVEVPSCVYSDDPWNLTWWVEIEIVNHTLPPRSALNEVVVSQQDAARTLCRCGRDGISFFSHSMGFVPAGAPVEQVLERPQLYVPDEIEVFEALAYNAGLTMSESSAGRFRRLAIELWGGLESFSEDLRDYSRGSLLKAWLSTASSGEEPGVFTSSKRRFLNLGDAAEVSGLSTTAAQDVLDEYVLAGILRRGLILQCQHCRLTEWYDLSDIGQVFECQRCRTKNTISRRSWTCDADQAQFYYDLAEVVFQALQLNVHVPIRALARLQEESRTFFEMSETQFSEPSGNKIELDLLAVVDGRIVLGEAKVGDRLQDTAQKELDWLRRFASIADHLTADEVVFATADQSWREVTVERIHTVFESTRSRVRLLEGL